MSKIPISLRRLVIQRASDRCEYCGLSQAGQAATFHNRKGERPFAPTHVLHLRNQLFQPKTPS